MSQITDTQNTEKFTSGKSEQAKTVVLVHGAFADGSVWSKVIPLLKHAGLNAISVQNPMASLEGDVEYTNRAIRRAEGPVVLVGHSWGGVVITEAGVNNKVKSLVYIAGFAPDKDQSLRDLVVDYDTPEGVKTFTPDEEGYVTLPYESFKKYMAPELSEKEWLLLEANQGAMHMSVLGEPVSAAAWREKPSFFAVSSEDQMMPTGLQHKMVETLAAESVVLKSGHASMISQPQAVADLIIAAAR